MADAETPPPADQPKRERELRLALVCYGGVSLAVYMHGITQEIVKLARASCAYHALPEQQRGSASFPPVWAGGEEPDTELVYFELLRQIGDSVALRVVVDVVAGASAGGITGIMLARALAFDLPLERHRSFWLGLADVSELLAPEARAGRWSKLFMRPFFWGAALWQHRRARRQGVPPEDPAVLRNLSLFMRSRWFEPPFSGPRMSEMMLDALLSLGNDRAGDGSRQSSLLPPGLPLELFVTTTDFWGYRQSIRLHDPVEIDEPEHRHIFRFYHVQRISGEITSQLSGEQLPSLAFAARATSSFPGAFPPARLAEMAGVLAARGMSWPGRATFVVQQFSPLSKAGEDPEDAAFIDGSVLMNKPMSLALQAVQRHVAHRETDRRLVYLEPNPDIHREFPKEVPGFFKTLKGALSDIPRNQPIRDDLEWIEEFNAQVRLQRQVVDAVKPNVMRMIAETLGERLLKSPDAEQLRRWRSTANARAAGDAAYAYEGYARLKVMRLLHDIGVQLKTVPGLEARHLAERAVAAWAQELGITPMGQVALDAQWGEDIPWIGFLRRFDVRHRLRRVLFLIRRANELYTEGAALCGQASSRWIDGVKGELYVLAEYLRARLDWQATLRPEALMLQGGLAAGVEDLRLDTLLDHVASELNLDSVDERLDRLLSSSAAGCPSEVLVRELVVAYLGFAYYDVLTYPMAQSRDLDALEEIKVDRIAVDDANTLMEGGAREILKGVEFGSFGAFFSRRFRENDYLWGRLTGAERLVDIVASAAPEAMANGLDLVAIKKRLFKAILAAEAPHLTEIGELIDELNIRANGL